MLTDWYEDDETNEKFSDNWSNGVREGGISTVTMVRFMVIRRVSRVGIMVRDRIKFIGQGQ